MSVHEGNNNLMPHCNSCTYCRQDKCFLAILLRLTFSWYMQIKEQKRSLGALWDNRLQLNHGGLVSTHIVQYTKMDSALPSYQYPYYHLQKGKKNRGRNIQKTNFCKSCWRRRIPNHILSHCSHRHSALWPKSCHSGTPCIRPNISSFHVLSLMRSCSQVRLLHIIIPVIF